MRDRFKTKSFSNIKLIFWGFFFAPPKRYPVRGIPALDVKVYFLAMKVSVFYTLFLGIFLAGGVAGQAPRLVLPVGHGASLSSAEFSPDGKYIVTSSYDETAKLWDVVSGKLLLDMKGFRQLLNSARFSPDGSKIFITAMMMETDSMFAKILETKSGKELRRFKMNDTIAINASFTEKGEKLIASLSDSSVKIWSTETGKIITVLSNVEQPVKSANFSIDGTKIVAVYFDDSIATIWDAATGQRLTGIRSKTGQIKSATFSPDGKKILALSNSNIPRLWDATTGKLFRELKGHRKEIAYATFNSQGDKVLTVSWDSTAKIWDSGTGNLLVTLLGHQSVVCYGSFSPDGKKVITTSWDKTSKLWEAETGHLITTMYGHTGPVRSAKFNFDGSKLVTTSDDLTAKIWDLKTGNLLANLGGKTSPVLSAFNDQDDKYFVATDDEGKTKIWNAESFTLASTINDPGAGTTFASFSSSGNCLITAGYKFIKLWDLQTNSLKVTFSSKCIIQSAELSKNQNRILGICIHDSIEVWDIETKKLLLEETSKDGGANKIINYKFLDPTGKKVLSIDKDSKQVIIFNLENRVTDLVLPAKKVDFAYYNPDGSTIVTSDYSGQSLQLWDAKTGKRLVSTKTKNLMIDFLQFSKEGDRIGIFFLDKELEIRDAKTLKLLFASDQIGKSAVNDPIYRSGQFNAALSRVILAFKDNTIKVFNTQTGRMIYSFFPIDSAGSFVYIPQGYFLSSTAAAKLTHYVTKDLKIISFEQLDVKYNRPDKVLEAIGNSDTALIRSYRKAWEKRIKKLGIDTTQFRDGYSVPECDFANREQIETELKTESLRLHIKAADSIYLLDRFNIWINESPLFGQRGISIKRKNSNTLDTIITIKLSQGENRIECSITNVNGTESYRMPLYVNYTPAVKQKESLRFIGIGIDRFSEKGHDLQYSVKDIRDLSAKLKEKYGSDIQIDTLFNENVSSHTISALKKHLLQTSVNDKVILAYSGHGLLSKDFDYYLSTYTVSFDQPERNGLSYDELEDLLDSIPARRKLMLIDACHSGEVDKEEMSRMQAAEDTLQQQGTKGGKPTFTGKTTLGMKNSFELMQSLFVNVGKSTGATVISAAAGTQFALERGDLKNGVFTYSILEAMNNYPSIKISELRKIVGERVEKLTNGLQKPTSRNETIASDWEL